VIGAITSRVRGLFYKLRYFPRIRGCKLFCEGTLRLGAGSLISGGVVVIGKNAIVDIAAGVYIGDYCNIRAHKMIKIGAGSKIAQFVSLVDHDYDFQSVNWGDSFKANSIEIGARCMLGAGAVVLRGVTVPPDSIVPANLVLRRNGRNSQPAVIPRQSA
jgi:acetyltransferase-like isoleucine patch superfamily enzyme